MMDKDEAAAKPRKRSRIKIFLLVLFILVLLVIAGISIVGERYHGPLDLNAVAAVMPGVPLFPFADMAPTNRTTQCLLAVPLLLMRLRGAERAEAALLQVSTEQDFVLDWYRRAATYQDDWEMLGESQQRNGARLLFTRNSAVLQVIIGHTTAESITPIQLIYLDGVPPEQLSRLKSEAGAAVK